ncbi:MAG: asparagine synthase (glutamine-hydrolyzing) [Acidobacteria bacterium]|nr:MAG: asparagine synthase (glutamine-hydrolyzing) [Acidobacteriota bacterium]
MCGIAGVFRGARPGDDRQVVASMLEVLRPRGPDSDGLLVDGPLTLGHRRLAILDLSPAGRQPMESHSGRFVVTYNGEIYNFREVRGELGLDESELRSSGDTEILLEAWERWGPECLSRLVGQFAFAMYDRREQKLTLVRDRVGEKPLYYHESDGTTTFASSLKALLCAPWVGRNVDEDALVEYLALRYVVAPRTVLADARKLRPGHLLEIDSSSATIRRWWKPQFRGWGPGLPRIRREDAIERFGELFHQAVRRCLVSDIPVALLLSDGIDSNAIRVSLRAAGADLSSYTFHLDSHRTQAVSEAQRDPSVQLQSFRPDEIHDHLEAVLSSLTEPVGDGSSIPTWLLIRGARDRAGVFLCGHGGDEVLGGYHLSQHRFRLALARQFCRLPRALAMPAVEYWTHGAGSPQQRHRALQRSTKHDWPAAIPYLLQRPLDEDDLSGLLGRPAPPERHLASIARLYGECESHLTDIDRMQYVMMETFFAANILSFADAVSMDSSAELRMPFVDRDLMEFAFSLPRELRVSRWPGVANTKRILRYWAERNLPSKVVNQQKRSFRYGSIRYLLRKEGSQVRSRILDAPFLRRRLPGLEKWMNQDVESYRVAREGTFWALLSFAIWGTALGCK